MGRLTDKHRIESGLGYYVSIYTLYNVKAVIQPNSNVIVSA